MRMSFSLQSLIWGAEAHYYFKQFGSLERTHG